MFFNRYFLAFLAAIIGHFTHITREFLDKILQHLIGFIVCKLTRRVLAEVG